MKTNQLSTQLQRFNMGTDQTFLTKLTKHIFSRYLDQYKDIEITFLRNKCGLILMRYYDGKGALRVTRVLRGDSISTRERVGNGLKERILIDFQPFAFIFRSRKTRCATLNGCRHCTSRHTSQNSEQRYVFIAKKTRKTTFFPTPYRHFHTFKSRSNGSKGTSKLI